MPKAKKIIRSLKKSAPNNHSTFFRLAIVAVVLFLTGSLYQLLAKGTGPLAFLTGSSEVFVVGESTPPTCDLPDGVCQKVNGCTWSPAIYSENKVVCSDDECRRGKPGCSGKNITITKTVDMCEDPSVPLNKCKLQGLSTYKGTDKVITYSCTGTYYEDILEKAGSCSGKPIVTPIVTIPADGNIPSQTVGAPTVVPPKNILKPITDNDKSCCIAEKNSPSCTRTLTGRKTRYIVVDTHYPKNLACDEGLVDCPRIKRDRQRHARMNTVGEAACK